MAVALTIKRDSITILADILKAISFCGSARKMAIVYKANLNFERIRKYLDLLVAAGLVETVESARRSESYRITVKGREFVAGYERLMDSLRLVDATPLTGNLETVPIRT